jgi:hypothetical protein
MNNQQSNETDRVSSRFGRTAKARDQRRAGSRLKPVLAWAAAGTVAAGLLSASPASPAAAFGISEHQKITSDALPFLRTDVFEDMDGEHARADMLFLTNNAVHFDGCEFGGGTADINDMYDDIIVDLDPAGPDPWAAADDFGFLTHPAEDFYSHSNWVELGRTDLIDAGLQAWTELGDWVPLRDDIVVGQGEVLPAGWTFAPFDNAFVPNVLTDGAVPQRVLVSGINDSGSDLGAVFADDCHDDIEIFHSELSKDDPNHPRHDTARALAVRQVEHEWCRLLNLLTDEYGPSGAALPLTLWTGPKATPHAAGTPCAPTAAGTVPVTVTPTAMHVIESTDEFGGELNFVFGLYTTNLQRSTRAEVGPFDYGDDEPVAPGHLPPSLTLCVSPDEQVAVTMQGWDDDELGATDGVYNDMAGYEDENLRGPTFTLDPGFQPGNHVVEFGDMRASYAVSSTSVDTDADGLDQCGESAAGTLPNDADSDDDGLTDGDEVLVHDTDPLDADSDNDGLTDGDEVHTYGTHPKKADTDGDLVTDGDEVLVYGTDPLEGDSDDDGLSDGEEIQVYGTDPELADTDGEGLLDGDEVHVHGTNPLEPDTDFDGLSDLVEVTYGTDPNNSDSDSDGLLDGDDVEFVQHGVESVPESSFKSTGGGSQTAVLARLEAVESSLLNGKDAAALKELADLHSRVDGCGSTADNNDWITDCASQLAVRSVIELLIDNITT